MLPGPSALNVDSHYHINAFITYRKIDNSIKDFVKDLDKSLTPILVIGRRCVGKSAICNSLIGKSSVGDESVFKSSLGRDGVTRDVQYEINGKYIIIDTPGFITSGIHETRRLFRALNICAYFGGYGKVLFVSRVDGTFDYEIMKHLIIKFKSITGQPSNINMDLVFTHADASSDQILSPVESQQIRRSVKKIWHINAHSLESVSKLLKGVIVEDRRYPEYFVEYEFYQYPKTGKWSMSYKSIQNTSELIHATKPVVSRGCTIM